MKSIFIASACFLYVALSLACAFAPGSLPISSLLGAMIVGPPALLSWGAGLLPAFAGFTSVGLGLSFAVARSRTPEVKITAGWLLAAVWVAGGLFSTLLSI